MKEGTFESQSEQQNPSFEEFEKACEALGLSKDMSARGLLNAINPENFEEMTVLAKKNPLIRKRLDLIMYIQSILQTSETGATHLRDTAELDLEKAKILINKKLQEAKFKLYMENLEKNK